MNVKPLDLDHLITVSLVEAGKVLGMGKSKVLRSAS
jgi:hypothetical protein